MYICRMKKNIVAFIVFLGIIGIASRSEFKNEVSIAQDMLYKKLRTEVDTLTGTISDYGKQFNVPTPTCDVLSDIVRCIQDNYDNQYGEKNGAVNA